MEPHNVYIDVTNTQAVSFTSGIQRVTRELVYRLTRLPPGKVCFVPIVYCDVCRKWYRLNTTELDLLTSSRSRSYTNGSLARALKSRTRRQLERTIGMDRSDRLVMRMNRIQARLGHPADHRRRPALEPEPGSIFLDMESPWHNTLSRSVLLPRLANNGVAISTLHHDIIPVLFPELVHPKNIPAFNEHLRAHLDCSSQFICISDRVKRDLWRYCEEIHHERRFETAHITLGGDYRIGDVTSPHWPLPSGKGRIVLCVGTIEPRKNQQLLLQAFEYIADRFPDALLVLAGRPGWRYDGIVRAIRRSRLWRRQLFWLPDVDDRTLGKLYERAYLAVVPSRYEGYGLPVAESLTRKCVTLSSSAGGLPEAGLDFADYFPSDDLPALQRLLEKYFADPLAHEHRRRTLAGYPAHTWQETARELSDLMERLCDRFTPAPARKPVPISA